MKQSPIIGVTPLWDAERKSVWMLPDYLDGIKAAGGLPIVLSFDMTDEDADQIVEICDGFLFTGGQDVGSCPEREKWKHFCCRKPCRPTNPYSESAVDFSSSMFFWAVHFGRIFPHNILRRLSTGKASLTVLQRIKFCWKENYEHYWAKSTSK